MAAAQGHHCLAAALVHAALRRQIASDVWSGVHGCAALCPPGVGVEAVARRELLSEGTQFRLIFRENWPYFGIFGVSFAIFWHI